MSLDLAAAKARLTDAFPLVDDHPDVAGVLRDPQLLGLTGQAMAAPFVDAAIDLVMAPEARGPILGALVARELDAGLVLARKAERNHPGADIPVMSEPTWRGRSETFQGRSFDLTPGSRVLIVDDWITTGSTIRAAQAMLRICGADNVGVSVLVNKADPTTLAELNVQWLVAFEDLVA